MSLSITFLGAARNVTGSRHLVEAGGARVLIDCGLYQERQNAARNWEPFSVPPPDIDAVVLTHAHVDHAGWLPRLVRQGFRGLTHCSSATAEIVPLVLADAATCRLKTSPTSRSAMLPRGANRFTRSNRSTTTTTSRPPANRCAACRSP
jgi:Cft2 family RNA processing exonuclease